jgi:prolipoprotein diacylglyceryl transferase
MFRKEKISDDVLDKLVVYMVLATIVGARLGHVLFYGPYWDQTIMINGVEQVVRPGYFSQPLEILKIWEGGLASHGGAIAILIALYIFSKRVSKRSMMWILDRIVAPIAIAGCFIRFGNLVNSEIVGNVTSVPWGFQFIYNDCLSPVVTDCNWADIPVRHPSQLYESLSYIAIFLVLIYMYWKRNAWSRQGVMFGTFLILLWGARFMVEFTKIPQVDERADWALNTGQLLSIPFFIVGIFILWRALKSEPQELDIREPIQSGKGDGKSKSTT